MKRPTEDKSLRYVSVWDVLLSVGVNIEMLSEFAQYGESAWVDPTTLDLIRTLSTANEMLSACAIDYEGLFKTAQVELPPNIVQVRMKNPLYEGDTTKPTYDDEGDVVDLGDEP